MNDPVNNPNHYNQNGIEVIDVIETYAKHDFRLANVLKYVCRAGYKGHPLQDLQKAQWYLNRVVSEMEELEELEELEDHLGPGYTEREVEVFFQGYDCRKQEEAEEEAALADEAWKDISFPPAEPYEWPSPQTKEEFLESLREAADLVLDGSGEECPTFHSSLATRIAGEDEAAHRLKDEYYGFNRFEIQGYCANCDAEITLGQPYVKDNRFDEDVKFCGSRCADALVAWQREMVVVPVPR